ncbi:transcriptional regulator [Candidatus Nitrospira bockiana]
MPERDQTPRQALIAILTGSLRSSYELARLLGLPERQVEEHLAHIVRTLARDRTRRFVLEPAECPDCGFVFRGRTRLTRPSRCPRCRGEGVTGPRYGIEPRTDVSSG